MSRARSLKPGFFRNEDLAALAPLTRLLFQGLWTLADRAGRLEDRPKRIKAEVLPYDACDVDAMLTDLAAAGFIERYETGGRLVVQVVNFLKHQRPHPNEPESEFTSNSSDSRVGVKPSHQRLKPSGNDPTHSGLILDPCSLVLEEQEGREALTAPSLPAASAEPPVLEFPCVGSVDRWALTQTQIDIWQQLYPNVSVVAECRRALAWVQANTTKRKTARGMSAFLVRWLNRAVDCGRGPSPAAERPAHGPVTEPHVCPHVPACGSTDAYPGGRWRCQQRSELDAMRQQQGVH